MSEPTLVVHGHFYQPPRENPWTEVVAAEPSAAPYHDWNERITAECYRPNGWARIVDEHGRLVAVVDNYAHLSFNVGPTLASWLAVHAPDVLERMVAGDRAGGGAIAQGYNHLILPLANERDVRTQVRWGLADFRHRFGRPATGMWLPETAVDAAVLAVLAEEGVGFTVLAPGQAQRVRPIDHDLLFEDAGWVDVDAGSLDVRRPYRWFHPERPELSVDIVFYDGPLAHDVAFGVGATSASALVERARSLAPDGGLVAMATDGETFGHHHRWGERALAYALPVEAPRNGVRVSTVAGALEAEAPTWEVVVHESSWSCAHGVERWRSDCGCSTGGPVGSSQAWRGPLRAALDVLRDTGIEVFERRGKAVLADPWAARDAYGEVVVGAVELEAFVADHVIGDRVEALTLLEQQRHAMLMYTSCGWFFWDLAGLETVQILRYAARAMDLLAELGEEPPLNPFLDRLADGMSNQPAEGDGRAVWERHVVPSRVDARRVTAHLALAHLLGDREHQAVVAGFAVEHHAHHHAERGGLALCSGVVALTHRRTGRRSVHAYAALHLGGLEVLGAVRPSEDDGTGAALRAAFDAGERVTTLLRLLADGYGPHEFGLDSALPDAAEEIVAGAAAGLAERFGESYERLVEDHRGVLGALTTAGLPLPTELRVAVEVVLARRFDAEVMAQHGSWDPAAYESAMAVARQAAEEGVRLDSPRARAALERSVRHAVARACAGVDDRAVEAALSLLRLSSELGIGIDTERAQEQVYELLVDGRSTTGLEQLGSALGLAVESLGVPFP